MRRPDYDRGLTIRVRPRPVPGWHGDHPDDIWVWYIPLHERYAAMKAATKTVLFARIKVGTANHLWPVGVFANDKNAKAFTSLLAMAHTTGNKDLAVKLDPDTRLAEDGTLIKGIKFSIKIVAYEPALAADGTDVAEESSSSLL